MFGLGTPELIIILVIALVVFGGNKLPEIGAGVGRALGSLKKGLDDIEEAGLEVRKDIPGVKEIQAVQEKLDMAKEVAAKLNQ